MVAIVSGNSLGLSLTSLANLGQQGAFGSAGSGSDGALVFVNAANGNLVLQSRDELLAGLGRDASSLRTYNSQGQFTDDNGDNWSNGIFLQQLKLNGTLNTAGSTLVRTDRDGAQAVYTYDVDVGHYVTTAGAGAHDTIAYDGSNGQFAWTDGSTGEIERYDAATGRLISAVDTSGNTLTYGYDAQGRLSTMTTAGGETIHIDYSGNNISQLRVERATATGTETLTTTRYTYDAQNRLASVIVDLSPEDSSVADGNVYVTSYTYDGTSDRVASVSQTDGTSLAISYVQVAGEYRVETLTNALGEVTRFSYDTANHRTTVTDPLGLRTVYGYDAEGQLLSVTAPSVDGMAQVTSFTYDPDGNLTSVTDSAGRTVQMGYDEHGNQITQRDSAGNTVTRTYDAYNQLLTETGYAVADSDGAGSAQAGAPSTTRYVYDAAGRHQLRFAITATGDVIEYRYDAQGNQVEKLQYGYAPFDVSTLGATAVPAEADMEFWARLQDPSRTGHVVRSFDFRGQVTQERSFTVPDQNGVADALPVTVHYVYDSAGRLLSSIAANGGISTYTYDGFGRVLTATDALDVTTVSSYDDANRRSVVTLASGLVTTTTYDAAGRLLAVVQGSNAAAKLGETRYQYDAAGRLLMSTDPTGASRWALYDDAGRKVADIDADGTLTEYIYHANNLLAGTIVHATRVDISRLANAAGEPLAPSLASIRPAANAADQREWRVYDAANRLVQVIDGLGYVTETNYDGASHVIAVTRYAAHVTVPATGVSPITSPVAVTVNPAADRVTRSFYDADGRVIGDLDPENYYTHYDYDAADRLVSKTRYAQPMVGTLVDAQTPPQLIAEDAAAPTTAYVRLRTSSSNPLPTNVGDGTTGLVDAASLLARLQAFKAVDPEGAFKDLVRLVRDAHVTLLSAGFNSAALLRQWVGQLPAGSPMFNTLASLGVFMGATEVPAGTEGAIVLATMDNDGQPVGGTDGNDVMIGGPGADTLEGGAGDDTLGGANYLDGGEGSDTYLFGYGDGRVEANAGRDDEGNPNDIVQLGAGITTKDIALLGDFNSPRIVLVRTGESLSLYDAVREIRFADGTIWKAADINNRLALGGPDDGQYSSGYDSNGDNLIRGGGGNDYLNGGYGYDTIVGGSGDDVLVGQDGGDLIEGGDGDDDLLGGDGSWWNNNPLNDNDTLDGGAGDDVLNGGFGQDVYVFGYGSGRDTITTVQSFVQDRWANADTLRLKEGVTPEDLIFSRDSNGGLLIQLRNSADSITVQNYFTELESEDDWYGGYAKGLEYIEFADGTLWEAKDIQIRLDPHYVSGESYVDDLLIGTDGSDYLIGRSGNDTFRGGAGDDTLMGGQGTDVFEFGLGNGHDFITAGWSGEGDRLKLDVPSDWSQLSLVKVGNDLQVRISLRDVATISGADIDFIEFSDGVVWDADQIKANTQLATDGADVIDRTYESEGGVIDGKGGADSMVGSNYADDTLLGGAGRDTLIGLAGNDNLSGGIGRDLLIGGEGADTYRFHRGDGADTISNTDWGSYDVGYRTGDSLVFGSDILAPDVVLARSGNDLVLLIDGTEDSVTLSNYFNYESGAPDIRLTNIQFGDGKTWTVDDVAQRLADVPPATVGDLPSTGDDLYQSNASAGELISTGTGNDTLIGSQFGDTLVGGADDDVLDGRGGDDVYRFSRGDGRDTVLAKDPTDTSHDVVEFGDDILPSDLRLTVRERAIIVTIRGTSDALVIQSILPDGTQGALQVQAFKFANGETWDLATIVARATGPEGGNPSEGFDFADTLRGTQGADWLSGFDGNDLILGGEGDDSIDGGAGDDTLDGGIGDDTYYQSTGNDVYRFGRGSGRDRVEQDSNLGGHEAVEMYAGVKPSDVIISVGRQGGYEIRIIDSGDILAFSSQLPDEIRFADGTVWDRDAMATEMAQHGAWQRETTGLNSDYYDLGSGAEIPPFGVRGGEDTIGGVENAAPGTVIQLAAGLRPEDLYVVASVDDASALQLRIKGTTDTLTVTGYLTGDAATLPSIRFADGTEWTAAQLQQRVAETSVSPDQVLVPTGTSSQLLLRQVGDDLEIVDTSKVGTTRIQGWYAQGTHVDQFVQNGSSLLTTPASATAEAAALQGRDQTTRLIYDALGRLVGEVDAENYLTENIYNAAGQRVSTVRYSRPLTVEVSATDRLIDIRPSLDQAARVSSWKYDLLGRVSEQTNGEGLSTSYTYDEVGNLVTTRSGASTDDMRVGQVRYDLQGRLVGELSGEGAARLESGAPLTEEEIQAIWDEFGIVHTYDAAGRRTSTTDANGHKTVFYYNADGQLRYAVNGEGEVQERRYNALNQLESTVLLANRLAPAALASLSGGLVTSSVEQLVEGQYDLARDTVTGYTYTVRGQLHSTTDALSHTATVDYNAFGEVNHSTAADGQETSLERDRRGQVTTTLVDPSSKAITTSAQYDAFGRLVRSVDAMGHVSQQSFDRLGRVVQTVDATNATRSTTWDAFDRTLTQTDALGNTTTYSYSDADRSVTLTTPEGVQVQTIHNLYGQTSAVIDALGNRTEYRYDHDGRLVTTTDAQQHETTNVYDAGGRLSATVDKNGVTTAFTYDAANRVLTRTVDPDGLAIKTTYRYDAKGQTIKVTDANDTDVVTEYDLLGHVLKQTIDPTGLNIQTSYSYDEAGRVLTVVDALGVTTVYGYDSLGRRTSEVRDPGGLNQKRTYEYDANGNVTATLGTDSALGLVRKVSTVYDALNRPVLLTDATGALTYIEYDAEGRVLRTTKLATALDVTNPPQTAHGTVQELVDALRSGLDRVETNRYDADGRLRFTVNSTGAVVELRYDARGNVVERIAYAMPISSYTWDGESDPQVVANDAVDQHIRTVYDELNRAQYVIDALGYVTQNEYDPAGHVVRQTVYATATTGTDNLPPSVSDKDRSTSFVYDNAGRVSATIDPTGAVTRNTYDDNGNLISQTRYANALPAGAGIESLVTDAARDRTTTTRYDAANRAVYATDAAGYVTTSVYDDLGHVTSTTRWAAKPAVPGDLPPATPGVGQTNSFTYDTAGHVLTSTDALNQTESYTYNAFGDKTSFTNKKGSTWNYGYDAAGRMVSELGPAVTLTTVTRDAKGNLVEGTTNTQRIETRLEYDALGNLTKRIEAVGRPEERSTSYWYDLLGRQVGVIYPAASVYAEDQSAALTNGANGVAARAEQQRQLSSYTDYDVFGNAIMNVDVAGNVSYKFYDKGNHVVYDVDAMGQVTQYTRDGFGDAVEITRYATALTRQQLDNGPAVRPSAPQIAAIIAGSLSQGDSRTVLTEYDQLGRAVTVREPTVFTVDPTTGAAGQTGKTTRNAYDSFGALVLTRSLLSGSEANGTWADTYQYFDVLGRLVDKVDAMGYRSTSSFDAFGNVASTTEYATALTAGSWSLGSAGTAATSQDDRRVEYTYDQLNRKTSETRKSVVWSTAVEALSGQSHRGDQKTTYGYDAVGNLTVTTDALGGSTYSYYDALGRVTAVAAPSRATATGSAAVLTPLTLYRRDAYGNVVVTVELANGGRGTVAEFKGVSNGVQLAGLVGDFSTVDRQSFAAYDLYGHVTQSTDAQRHSVFNSYNASGLIAKTWQGVTSGAALVENGTDASGAPLETLVEDSTVFKLYEYDALGELIHTYDPGPANALVDSGKPAVTGAVYDQTITKSAGALLNDNFYSNANAVSVSWVGLTDPALGSVRVELDFMTTDEGGFAPLQKTQTQEFAAGDANRTVTMEWWDDDAGSPHGISSVRNVRVQQRINGVWTTVWNSATAGTTNVPATGYSTKAAPASLVRTDLNYNAYGELTSKGLDGGAQEYFDYDAAGRLWRTNSGDGVDKIYLYDQMGRVVSELRSNGSGGQNVDLKTVTSAEEAARLGASVRRSDTVYDILGRVIETRGADRAETATMATGKNEQVSAAVVSSSAPDGTTESVVSYWVGSNVVAVNWPDLSHLGSGDIKVEVDYLTTAASINQWTTPVEARSYAAVFTAEQAATGVTLSWPSEGPASEPDQHDGATIPLLYAGGLASVNAVRVYKRDPEGNWQLLHAGSSESASKVMDVALPTESNLTTKLEVRAAGSSDEWVTFPQDPVRFTQALRYNLDVLGGGTYEYRLTTSVAGSTPVVVNSGIIHPDGSTETYYVGGDSSTRPTIHQTLDRWGNVLSVTDARTTEWVTTYQYNADNQVIAEQKPSSQTMVNGSAVTVEGGKTQVYYDALGRQAAVRDANGNLNSQVYDAAGNVIEEHHADGGIVTNTYDVFGNKVRTVNAEGNRDLTNPMDPVAAEAARRKNTTEFVYDKMNRLVETRHAEVQVTQVSENSDPSARMQVVSTISTLTDRNVYDQAGRRISQTTGISSVGAGETMTYKYDLAGRVIETTQPGGDQFKIRTVYDKQGHKIAEVDQNGNASTWTYDYFGKLQARTDLGGATFTFTYDNAGQLTQSTNTRFNSGLQPQLINTYNAAGDLKSTVDSSLNQTTEYWYDLAGRHVREKTTQGSTVYQDNLMAYDEVGRLRHVNDGRMSIDITYDAAGNRTNVKTHVNVPSKDDPTQDVPKDSDLYFTYDSMNRQTGVELARSVSDTGVVSYDYVREIDKNGQIVAGTSGHKITYDLNGNRIRDQYLGTKVKWVPGIKLGDTEFLGHYEVDKDPANSEVTEVYEYDALNRLLTTTRDDVQIDQRQYDAVGRVVTTGPVNLPTDYAEAINSGIESGQTIGLEYRINRYDNNGRLAHQQIFNADQSKFLTDLKYKRYDDAGNLQAYTLETKGEYTNTYTYTHAKYDGYKEAVISGTSTKFDPGQTTNVYDINGNLIRVDDKTKDENDRELVNDLTGHALFVMQGTAVQRQVVVNGEVLGRYGVGIDASNPRDKDGNPVFTELADFNFGYQPITGNYPTASVGTYQVKAGDTLRSIAQQSYGDEGFWYRIAETNGLSGDRDLRVGQTINIPSVVGTVRNNASTYKPYDPSKITGDTMPNMPSPNSGGGCGGIGMLLVVVVAVVVTVFTAGAAAMAMAGTLSAATSAGAIMTAGAAAMSAGTLAGVAAAAVGAAVGSIVSQGVAMAIGMQEQFSWKQVGLSAIGGAVSSGLGPASGFYGGPTVSVVLKAATSNAITQGIGVATGLQDKFNWKGVAASAAAAFVAKSLSDTVLGSKVADATAPGGFSRTGGLVDAWGGGEIAKIAGSTVLGIAAGATASLVRGGRVVVQQVATDAFGNALADSIVAKLQSIGEPTLVERADRSQASNATLLALADKYGGLKNVPADLPQVQEMVKDGLNNSATIARLVKDQVLAAQIGRGAAVSGGSVVSEDLEGSPAAVQVDARLPTTYVEDHSGWNVARLAATTGGVITGLFQSIGDGLIGGAELLYSLNQAQQYVLLQAAGPTLNQAIPGYEGRKQSYENISGIGEAVRQFADAPGRFVSEAAGATFRDIESSLETAEKTRNLSDWFFYGAKVGHAVMDVAGMVEGLYGLSKLGVVAAGAAVKTAKAVAISLAPKMGEMLENYMPKIGAIRYIVPATRSMGGATKIGN
ncbi:YD repeat-containing protein, partial [Roseateles sp. YR242]|uniref:calcium-binding protein n=1 Tax=Roseateles sp. YR242 TaxID=1855305 RepID=UPI0008BB166B